VSSNPTHCEVYLIHYVIKFVRDLGLWFSLVSSNNKTDHHNITEILLKAALNTISLTRQIRAFDYLPSSIFKLFLSDPKSE
jgi:hypothetical protein